MAGRFDFTFQKHYDGAMNAHHMSKFCQLWFLISLFGLVILGACQKPEHDASLKHQNQNADNLLLSAVLNNNIEQVGILISSGKIKNINMVAGQSLLKIAFDQFQFDIAKLLLDSGADANIQVMHADRPLPIIEYLFLRSHDDSVGYNAIMMGFLIEHQVGMTPVNLSQDLFMQILEKRVIPLAQKEDLLFTTWLALLKNIFQKQCFEGDRYSPAYLELCSNYIHRFHLFLEEAKQDQVVELNIGNIDLFMKDFDLCPQNINLLFPGVQGC